MYPPLLSRYSNSSAPPAKRSRLGKHRHGNLPLEFQIAYCLPTCLASRKQNINLAYQTFNRLKILTCRDSPVPFRVAGLNVTCSMSHAACDKLTLKAAKAQCQINSFLRRNSGSPSEIAGMLGAVHSKLHPRIMMNGYSIGGESRIIGTMALRRTTNFIFFCCCSDGINLGQRQKEDVISLEMYRAQRSRQLAI